MRTFAKNIMFAAMAAALGACGVGSDCGHGVENCSTDSDITDDTNDTSDESTGEIEVVLTYPDGSTADGVKVGFGDVVSGSPATVPAGEYSVSVSPFEGQDTRWFVADDGDNDVTVVADESATVTVGLDRFVSSSGSATPIGDQGADAHTVYDYNCWTRNYDYNETRADSPNYEYDEGWFSVETRADGTLSIQHEVKGSRSSVNSNQGTLSVSGDKISISGFGNLIVLDDSEINEDGSFEYTTAVLTSGSGGSGSTPERIVVSSCTREE